MRGSHTQQYPFETDGRGPPQFGPPGTKHPLGGPGNSDFGHAQGHHGPGPGGPGGVPLPIKKGALEFMKKRMMRAAAAGLLGKNFQLARDPQALRQQFQGVNHGLNAFARQAGAGGGHPVMELLRHANQYKQGVVDVGGYEYSQPTDGYPGNSAFGHMQGNGPRHMLGGGMGHGQPPNDIPQNMPPQIMELMRALAAQRAQQHFAG